MAACSCDDNDNDADDVDDDLQGDSGGPLTVADSGSGAHSLVGVVSFGHGCARVGSSYCIVFICLNQDFKKKLWHWMKLSSIQSSIKFAISRARASTESMQTCLSSGLGSRRQLQQKEEPLSAPHPINISDHQSFVYNNNNKCDNWSDFFLIICCETQPPSSIG